MSLLSLYKDPKSSTVWLKIKIKTNSRAYMTQGHVLFDSNAQLHGKTRCFWQTCGPKSRTVSLECQRVAPLNQTVHDFGPANYEKMHKTASFTVQLGVRVEQYVTLGHICSTVYLYFDFKPNSRRLWASGGSGCSFKPNSTQLRAQSPLLFDLNNPHHQLETQSLLLFDWKTPRDQLVIHEDIRKCPQSSIFDRVYARLPGSHQNRKISGAR